MFITNKDIEVIAKATLSIYESDDAPSGGTPCDFSKIVTPHKLKRYLYFFIHDKDIDALMGLFKRKFTPTAVIGTVCLDSNQTTQRAIVIDSHKIPYATNVASLQNIIQYISAKALEHELFEISEEIVSAAVKLKSFINSPFINNTIKQSLKNRVSDDLWGAFMTLQNVANVKSPTEGTNAIYQYYMQQKIK